MRVCTVKSTGRIIESQSGDGDLEVLINNAVNAGYSADSINVVVMPDKEFYALLSAQSESDKTYAEKRAGEYPPIGDQLDALYKAGVFPKEMASQIKAVKDKYPK